MNTFSTEQAAKMLGISAMTLSRYIKVKKVPAPTIFTVGGSSLHAWTEKEIENVRKLLPKIANGRKTRYKKKQSAAGAGDTPGKTRPPAKLKRRNR